MQQILQCLTFIQTNECNHEYIMKYITKIDEQKYVLGGQLNKLLITKKRQWQQHCNADTPPEQHRGRNSLHINAPHSTSENKRQIWSSVTP